MARNVKSTVKLNMPMVRKLTAAAKVSVAQTAEIIHTDVVQSQVIPRDTGALQNESTFVDLSDIDQGKAYLVSSTPYARRLYYHPENCLHTPWTSQFLRTAYTIMVSTAILRLILAA